MARYHWLHADVVAALEPEHEHVPGLGLGSEHPDAEHSWRDTTHTYGSDASTAALGLGAKNQKQVNRGRKAKKQK